MPRNFRTTGYLGVAVIVMSIVLLVVFPSKTASKVDGMITPVIAFEFLETPEEAYQLFGREPSPARDAMVAAMDLGNRLDFIYMILYTMFLSAFSTLAANESGMTLPRAGRVIAIIILLGDVLENVQLLAITEKLAAGGFECEIGYLRLFTWVKWGGIALTLLALAPYFLKGAAFARVTGIAGILAFLLGLISFVHRSFVNELFSLSVAVMFILMIVYCFIHRPTGAQVKT
jgi:hypothetical protein